MDLRSGFQVFLLSLVPSEGVGRRQRQGVRRGVSSGVCTTEEDSGVAHTRGIGGTLEKGSQSRIESRGGDGEWQVQPAGPQRGSARGCHGRGLQRGGRVRAERTWAAKGVQGAGEGHVAEPQAGRAPEGGRPVRRDGRPAFPPGLQTLGLRGQAAKDRARAIRWERGRGRQISGRFLRKTGTDAY